MIFICAVGPKYHLGHDWWRPADRGPGLGRRGGGCGPEVPLRVAPPALGHGQEDEEAEDEDGDDADGDGGDGGDPDAAAADHAAAVAGGALPDAPGVVLGYFKMFQDISSSWNLKFVD